MHIKKDTGKSGILFFISSYAAALNHFERPDDGQNEQRAEEIADSVNHIKRQPRDDPRDHPFEIQPEHQRLRRGVERTV